MCENMGEVAGPAPTGFSLTYFRPDRSFSPQSAPDRPGPARRASSRDGPLERAPERASSRDGPLERAPEWASSRDGPQERAPEWASSRDGPAERASSRDGPAERASSRDGPLERAPEWAKALLAGGIASCCAKTAVAPLDRTKILLQAHNSHYKHLGIFSTLEAIWRREGVRGWYKGNTCQMVRIFPYGAVQFMAFEQFKKTLTPAMNHPHLAKLLAGSLGGMAAVILTYPLDMVRVRLMFQVKGEHLYEGIWHTFRTIWAQEGGMLAFYRGFVPTLIGMVPYSGLSFFTFDTLKQLLLESGPRLLLQHGGSDGDRALRAPVNLVLGGVAGAIAQTASYPLDVTRRRMQLAVLTSNAEKFSGCLQTLLTVYQTDGVKHGLYRGISVNYLRVIPQVAMSFCVYEMCKQLLRMEHPAQNSRMEHPTQTSQNLPQNSQMEHPVQNSRMEHPVQNSQMEHPVQNSQMEHPVQNSQQNSNSQKPDQNSKLS